ncbi:MAG: 50S ribosomal protein L24 [Armatimonadetes bacterium]|nr:50S ribosomal protein L24 [Armatimonadota bacterium]
MRRKKKPTFEGKMRLKKGDEVIVLAGKDKGKRGKIIQTLPETGKVIVDGVNVVTRHQKPRSASSRAMVRQQLGEMMVPLGVPISKVMLVCPKCNKETRIARVATTDGEMARKCRKCGELVDA